MFLHKIHFQKILIIRIHPFFHLSTIHYKEFLNLLNNKLLYRFLLHLPTVLNKYCYLSFSLFQYHFSYLLKIVRYKYVFLVYIKYLNLFFIPIQGHYFSILPYKIYLNNAIISSVRNYLN